MRDRAPAAASAGDGLTELVSLEGRLAARLAAARREAADMVAAARARASGGDGGGDATLAAALAALREGAALSRERRLGELRAASNRRRARWERIPDTRLAALASTLVAEVVAELSGAGTRR